MRIGIFTDTYPPFINGVSTSISMLEHALRKKGHQVFIVTVNPENMKYKKEKNIIRIPGIPTGIYDYRLTGIYPVRAIKTIKNWNLDVIHTHTEFGIGTFARIIAKQLKIPLVHTYHTMYEDYVHYITKGYFNGTSKKIVEHLTKFYCDKTAQELIVPTKKAYDLFIEKYKVDKNVHIIPTGIEIDRFYKEKAQELNLEENIILTGKVPYNEINYYYNLGTVFVTASTTETQGLTVIEAMSASLPVVCIDDESFRNTVVSGLNGYLFKDKDEYIKYIEELMDNKKQLQKLGNQARISTDQYSSKYYAERVLDVYKKTIKEHKIKKTFLGKTASVIKEGMKD